MQSFIEHLKEVVYEVEQTGGDPLEKLVPSPSMTQRLREYASWRFRTIRSWVCPAHLSVGDHVLETSASRTPGVR